MSRASVFLNIEKAFDTTWHFGLLYKLSTLQFSISLIKLIGYFLSQKKFRISRSKTVRRRAVGAMTDKMGSIVELRTDDTKLLLFPSLLLYK
jgi:hypothetical protein